jgi:predicted transport protein
MILFETDKKPLTYFLDQIHNRDLALPDFQRSFVWDPESTRELIASIVRSFPAGNLLLMQGGAQVFAPRAFEQAPSLNGITPSFLVLDGQQRLTSLYQAFAGVGSHRFFLNVQELLEGLDVDEAVEVYAESRARKWLDLKDQAQDLMLPLNAIRSFAEWKDDVLDLRNDEDRKKMSQRFNEIDKEYVHPVEQYQFPVTTLSASTPVEAVCTIFETLNRTGVKLSVFELITARAFAHEIRLRDMWDDARNAHQALADFNVDPYYALQATALREVRSAKRSAVLALGIDSIVELWDEVVAGMGAALELLRNECGVLTPRQLPYITMVVTMGATWHAISEATGPGVGARQAKLKRWFWCSVFNGEYENSPNSTAERDARELLDWFSGGDEPSAINEFRFEPQRWADITGRQRALYRGTMALLMSKAPRDFHEGQILTKPIIDGKAVDDHHLFPRAYLASIGKGHLPDSVLNHTLIDKITNIRIGKSAPSDYLGEMRRELGVDLLRTIMESHGLPVEDDAPLLADRFEEFLAWRTQYLTHELARVTGMELVNGSLRSPARDGEAPSATSGDTEEEGLVALPSEPADQREHGSEATSESMDRPPPSPSPATPREMFEEIRRAALALGDDVGEHPHNRGASFRARRGFTTVYVRERMVRLGIALPSDHVDPRGLARKTNRKGMWSYRVTLQNPEDLPAVIHLVRQAYTAQRE